MSEQHILCTERCLALESEVVKLKMRLDNQREFFTDERDALQKELDLRRKSGSATDRLHNLIEGISRDADGSEWSREEWGRLDAENAALRKQVTELTAERDALQADARRYRWLREQPEWLGWEHDFRSDEIDREVDEAMK